MKALGMVEVRGFLGAVSAADAALKAANVELNSEQRVGGGRRTILLVGDVAAVQAAVDAAVVIAKQLGCYCTSHVISRADEAIAKLMGGKLAQSAESDDADKELITANTNNGLKTSETEPLEDLAGDPEKNSETQVALETEDIEEQKKNFDESALRKKLMAYKVVDLRKKAYVMNVHGMKRTAIKFANKEALIKVIIDEVKRGGTF